MAGARPQGGFRLRRIRAAVTLLELLLSLALTGVVMVVISMAIHLHLMTLDTQRGDVEQALLARSVLRHMAADIRNAVWYEQLDLSSLERMATTQTGNTTSGNTTSGNTTGGNTTGGNTTGGNSTGGNNTGSGNTGDTSSLDITGDMDLTTEPSANTTDIANTVTPTSVPGLYGNQYELRIDCSRLPRVDEYSGTLDPATGAVVSIPSDVKTVSYFLRTEDIATSGVVPQGSDGSTGLIRRVMDRAAASWAAQDGSLDASEHPGDVLAKEITYLEFRYSDGSTWYTEWDSEQMGGLPMAIEITIGLDPVAEQNVQEMDVSTATQVASADLNQSLYRLVVHLPVAQPLTTEDMSGSTGDSTGSSSGASGTSGGTSGTSSGGSGTAQGGTGS